MPLLTLWPNEYGVLSSAIQGFWPRVTHSPFRKKIVADFVYESGSSGPGNVRLRYQGPGDLTLGPTIITDPLIEPRGFDLSFAPSGSDSIILVAIPSGETEPAEWESVDNGETWTRL